MDIKRELTKAESEVMQILWKKKKAFVQEIIDEMPIPKPAYNTVSTVVRVLEQKGMVSHEAFGRAHRYFPTINKEAYTRGFMKNVMTNYFGNSLSQMVSFFTRQENLSIKEMEEIKQLMEQKIKDNKRSRIKKQITQ
jgi:predicted transcriptional regulator